MSGSGRWYFTRGGQPGGPVEIDKLREMASGGDLAPADIVWTSGSPGKPAAQVDGLFPPARPAARNGWLPFAAACGAGALMLACLVAAVWR